MSGASPAPPNERTGRHRRLAWLAVWSPPVAWVVALAVLMSRRLFPVMDAVSSGIAVGVIGLVGVFVVVPAAVCALLAALDARQMTARERTRLAWLSLFGVVFSLLGYGCLLALGGFVLVLSPFEGIRH